MVDHNAIKQLISVYRDREATPQETEIVKAHMTTCAECRKDHQDMLKLSSSLHCWTNEDLSPDLEQKIRKNLTDVKSREGKQMKTRNPLMTAGIGGGIIVSVLVLAVSLQVYTKRGVQGRLKTAADDIGDQYAPGKNASKVQIAKGLLSQKGVQFGAPKPSSLMAKAKDKKVSELAKVRQYKPYYMKTDYNVSTSGKLARRKSGSEEIARLDRTRDISGYQESLKTTSGAFRNLRESEWFVASGMPAGKFVPTTPMLIEEDIILDRDGYRYGGDKFNTEQYDRIYENEFLKVTENPLSTFSIDVDTASYSNMRRFLNNNQLPPQDAVRIEEMINYFTYDYPKPKGDAPFSITTKASTCPWNPKHNLVLVGLQGKTLSAKEIPASNLVFLIDVSGSMNQPDKLPLLKSAFKLLVNQLRSEERVAIVVYAGAAGLVLESTPGSDKQKILQAIDTLQAGGSTAGGAGIKLAYKIAVENLIKDGNNRVILATDGDFNTGVSSTAEMVRLIEEKRKEGIFLTILGFGTGNYKDSRMEQIADKGNGNYYYIDTQKEAKKVLVTELGSTLFAIAKDVKIQIEFNPSKVKAYRLIGYENRILAKEDFNDDTKDAGELGAGHSVTALYELVGVDSKEEFSPVDELTYQQTKVIASGDLMTVKLRYKDPNADKSKLLKETISADEITVEPQGDFQFASAVAEFGLLLRDSKYKENATYAHVIKNAKGAKGKDTFGYRAEFIGLVEQAQALDTRSATPGIFFKGE